MDEDTKDPTQTETGGATEQKLEQDKRAENDEAVRMLRAIRTLREQGLSASCNRGKWSVCVEGILGFADSGGVVGYGDSPADALFHFHRARDGKPYQPYPGHSFSLHDLPYVERMQWLVSIRDGQVERLGEEVAELRSLRADDAMRVTEHDLCAIELDTMPGDQQLVMTADTFRQFLSTYESPQASRARRERLDAAFPGPGQYSGPEPTIGLPRYYRIDRRTYETADGYPRESWFPGAFDPADRESMGFCGYDSPEHAAAECRRHAEHVRGDATGVELTPQWSASTIKAFWYRWCENKDGDSTKLTIADFVRDLCATVKS